MRVPRQGNGGDALPAVLTPGKGADSHFASTPERREPDCAREPELEARARLLRLGSRCASVDLGCRGAEILACLRGAAACCSC